MTIREYIESATRDAKTQIDLDRIWHQGFPAEIRAEFPEADPSEIMYEWDNIKIRIRRMV